MQRHPVLINRTYSPRNGSSTCESRSLSNKFRLSGTRRARRAKGAPQPGGGAVTKPVAQATDFSKLDIYPIKDMIASGADRIQGYVSLFSRTSRPGVGFLSHPVRKNPNFLPICAPFQVLRQKKLAFWLSCAYVLRLPSHSRMDMLGKAAYCIFSFKDFKAGKPLPCSA